MPLPLNLAVPVARLLLPSLGVRDGLGQAPLLSDGILVAVNILAPVACLGDFPSRFFQLRSLVLQRGALNFERAGDFPDRGVERGERLA